MEASHLLDLQKLIGKNPPNVLIPVDKKKLSILKRSPDKYTFSFMIVAFLFSIYLGTRNNFESSLFLVLGILIFLVFLQKNRIEGIYLISKEGLIVPYTWLTTKKLPFTQIVEVSLEKLIEKETGTEYDGMRITIDNPSLKYNFTGIQDSSIVLSSANYEKSDLEIFSKELNKFKMDSPGSPNTLPQRLTDQVNNSWFGRWKFVIFNTFETTSEFGYYLLLAFSVSSAFFGNIILLILLILFTIYFFSVFLFNIADLPSSIIGVRPHELGALIYNEADLLTTVRFIMMSRPDKINLLNCVLLFDNEPISQINELKELHPQEIEVGILTYCVAQFLGNHIKSIGASIKFSFSGDDDTEYELPIYWA